MGPDYSNFQEWKMRFNEDKCVQRLPLSQEEWDSVESSEDIILHVYKNLKGRKHYFRKYYSGLKKICAFTKDELERQFEEIKENEELRVQLNGSRRFSQVQKFYLDYVYAFQSHPSRGIKTLLGKFLELPYAVVSNWFGGRRNYKYTKKFSMSPVLPAKLSNELSKLELPIDAHLPVTIVFSPATGQFFTPETIHKPENLVLIESQHEVPVPYDPETLNLSRLPTDSHFFQLPTFPFPHSFNLPSFFPLPNVNFPSLPHHSSLFQTPIPIPSNVFTPSPTPMISLSTTPDIPQTPTPVNFSNVLTFCNP